MEQKKNLNQGFFHLKNFTKTIELHTFAKKFTQLNLNICL